MIDDMADFVHAGVRMLVMMFVLMMVMLMSMIVSVMVIVVMMMVMVVIMIVVLMVMMMFMLMMVVAFFLFAVDGHADVIALDAALHGRFHPHPHAGNSQRVQFIDKFCGIVQQGSQCAQKHVAGCAHAALKIQTFHRLIPSMVLILWARKPAPKPLSMLTTLQPLAQELSMDSSAASPPKLAPYPTLVGTAITGQSTRPPSTLASAPSIPAMATTTRALCS
jgi:hypothetical protein